MIYNISKRKSKQPRNGANYFLLHSDNEMLPICYHNFVSVYPYKKVKTFDTIGNSYRRYTYSDFYYKVQRYRQQGFLISDAPIKIFIAKKNLIIAEDFAYDVDSNKVLYAVVAPNELVNKGGRISSDQCLLYVSDHMSEFTNAFKNEVLGLFENFLGDMVVTRYPNQMVLGHPLFKPKSKNEINKKLKTLINEL